MNIFQVLLVQPLTNGLMLFYRILGQNLGVAILGFSLFLIFILRPLTKPYLNSMKRIKELEPEVSKLKKKYLGDKMGFSKAQADLYKERKINPAAGCLPYLLQFAVLIALFNVFTTALAGDGNAMVKVNRLLYPALRFDQNQVLNTKFLYLDVSEPDKFNVPGIPFALPGLFLILATVAQFLSVKITTPYISVEQKVAKSTKSDTDDMQVSMQKSMIYTLPLMTLFFGLSFPSGLALYWLVFSIVSVWQQVLMSGWGSLTPFVTRLGLMKLATKQ
ncbi:MAG: Membrane protein insertase, YidC/Oxa1 family [Candidatus Woesebacteria bacterium GW2011_GWA2_40_7b]|uniref:Membrane protein insertase, YidC/Oxa1 family n=1 Tax=Candidatus Woesebacteria bacterium GW2011_GWA2_40_7b TaxID=1618563 RepID=A0A0G0W687_9BACT|nr:MAG: Membrane protein insertase, YidC/Oxa1 family [Candidatus Woesebacteria bacterium GW2011_GWA2_40_7b]